MLVVHSLPSDCYWVEGGVANTGFIVGNTGVVAIDAQRSTDAAKAELDAIAQVTSKGVNDIIVTHADPDHVGGLPAFPAGSTIFGQENVNTIIEASIADPNGGPVFGPLYKALADFLPSQTIGHSKALVLDGVRMQLLHVAPAHTSADLIIFLPDKKIVYGGDIVITNLGPYPVIHAGGSSLGWIDFMRAILALDADIYVPGHGTIETKVMLQDRLHDAEQRREAVKSMVDQHRSLAEVEQALPDKPIDPRFPTYTHVVYEELTKGYPPAEAPWAQFERK